MKICILGGGGCFALNFARHLASIGVECFGIGRTGPREKAFWLAPADYRYWALHLGNEVDRLYAMALIDEEKPDVIVNFAAQGEGAASFEQHAPDFFATNCTALVQVVHELRKMKFAGQFIQISTSELYGSTDLPATELTTLNPTSPYAISKAAFDQYLLSMHRNFNFPVNIIRPSNCYTPGQQLHRIIPKAIICALSGKKLPLEGGGMARKSYLHADDLSRAIMLVVNSKRAGQVWNVGPISTQTKVQDGKEIHIPTLRNPIRIWELVNLIALECKVQFDDLVEQVPDRIGQDSQYWIDSSEIVRELGFSQDVDIETGIRGMVEWVRANPELLTMDTGYQHRV